MNTTPKNWEDLLPYEKFEIFGAQSLTDSELLAIIIRTGTKDANSIELGKKILNLSNGRGQTNGLLSLQHLTLEELMKIKGIGKVKAIRIKCVTEFSRRIAMETFKKGIRFDKPATIADYYKEQVRHLEVEQVILVMTDGKNQFLKDCVLSIGTVNVSAASTWMWKSPLNGPSPSPKAPCSCPILATMFPAAAAATTHCC